jgi:hypothetical protein
LQLDKQVFLARWGLQGHSAYGTLFADTDNAAKFDSHP